MPPEPDPLTPVATDVVERELPPEPDPAPPDFDDALCDGMFEASPAGYEAFLLSIPNEEAPDEA